MAKVSIASARVKISSVLSHVTFDNPLAPWGEGGECSEPGERVRRGGRTIMDTLRLLRQQFGVMPAPGGARMLKLTWPTVPGLAISDAITSINAASRSRRLCGLHAQVLSSAGLSVWARVEDLDRQALRHALWEDRTLVKTWAMRGTLTCFLPTRPRGTPLLTRAGVIRVPPCGGGSASRSRSSTA